MEEYAMVTRKRWTWTGVGLAKEDRSRIKEMKELAKKETKGKNKELFISQVPGDFHRKLRFAFALRFRYT
jgi:hypothetical protein